jgi:hypothetical protein
MPVFCFLLLGCYPGPVSEAQSDCASLAALGTNTTSHHQLYPMMSDGCIESVAGSIGLSLDSIPAIDSTPARIVTGLTSILLDSSRTIESDQTDSRLPLFAKSQHILSTQAHSLVGTDPTGVGWFAYTSDSITYTEIVAAEEMYGANARFRASDGRLQVSDSLPFFASSLGHEFPYMVGLLLVHEASHDTGPTHVDCTKTTDLDQCDQTEAGAYGVQLLLQQQWMVNSPDLLLDTSCTQIEALGQGTCLRINSSLDWPICTGERICN